MTSQVKTRFAEQPFVFLVHHFRRRLFASEEEQQSDAIGVGVGTVLALLAAPGGFASIVLFDKYSTLIQYFRGQFNFNPLRASIADEYFFVVLSMTIIGLAMVLRWNRLLPDRRDYANLAPLPIPIASVFLANFVALTGMGILFAIDINGVSWILFPCVVNFSDGTFPALLMLIAAHFTTVFLASMFSFFSVFALVGVLMIVLPASWFKPVSLIARMLLVVVLLTGFLSNFFLQLLAGKISHNSGSYISLLPSYWFLGIYQHMIHRSTPATDALARFAVTMLLVSIVVTIAAYTLCYRRHFKKLAESSSDSVGGARVRFPRGVPGWLAALLFRSPFEHACFSFMWRVLTRSERHLMFFGGYLAVGLVIIADSFVGRVLPKYTLPPASLLSVPLLIAFFVITGLRFVFDVPAAIDSNWVFRSVTLQPSPPPASVARRFMLLTVIPPLVAVCLISVAPRYGWFPAVLHAAIAAIMAELCIGAVLWQFSKIPFTCVRAPEPRQMMIRLILCLLTVLVLVPILASIEHWAIGSTGHFLVLAALLLGAWAIQERHRRQPSEFPALIFEERSPAAFELLKLA
ncbi:MAG: hypothetical protein WA324_11885 [Bryobacteraceae bacterium]